MKACVLHAAEDLRLEERDEGPLAADEVRVRIGAGGICGSDLHYYFEGRIGDFPVTEPFILGHEVAGTIDEVGSAVTGLSPGQTVAVNPSRPCGSCRFCALGRPNLCENMRFYGSAAVTPHVQGAFRERLTVRPEQCFPVPERLSVNLAAFAEPLSCALHAVSRADNLLGRSVLVAGAGPIGTLVMMAAKLAGAQSVTATDLSDATLAIASQVGADETINVATDPEGLAPYQAGKGSFDVAFEVTGSPRALADCIGAARAGGRIVQVGMLPPGEVGVAMNRLMAKELDMTGSFRFHDEFAWAVKYLSDGSLDPSPLLTGTFDLSDLPTAFAAARDRSRHMKVQLTF